MTKVNNSHMRFLVVRTDFLGDSVLSSAFIRMLHQIPNVSVDVLCYEYNYAAFKYNPELVNKYRLYKSPSSAEELASNKEVLKAIQLNNYTATFMLNRDLKTYALLKHISTKKVFGHRLGVRSTRSKLFCSITELGNKYSYLPYDNSIHEVVNQKNLLDFSLKRLNIHQQIKLDPTCYFYTENFNFENNYSRDTDTIVVNISGRRDTVRYIPSSLARTIIEDILKLGKKALIIATSDELDRANLIIKELNSDHVKLCTESNLFKVVDTMARHLYYIGADGGLLHIAAGLHMRCVGLFHAQNITAWHPWATNQVCIQTDTKKIYDLTSSQVVDALKGLYEN